MVKTMDKSVSSAVVAAFQGGEGQSMIESSLRAPLLTSIQQNLKKSLLPSVKDAIQEVVEQAYSKFGDTATDASIFTELEEQKRLLREIRESFKSLGGLKASSSFEETEKTDVKTVMQSLISQQKWNDAFAEALDTADLSNVMFVCSAAGEEPWKIIPSLSNPVVLSLMQQLSSNLATDTSVKLNWIGAALFNLKPEDPTIQAYVPLVLKGLQEKLTSNKDAFDSSQVHTVTMMTMMISKILAS